jgi:hypothetical protein
MNGFTANRQQLIKNLEMVLRNRSLSEIERDI